MGIVKLGEISDSGVDGKGRQIFHRCGSLKVVEKLRTVIIKNTTDRISVAIVNPTEGESQGPLPIPASIDQNRTVVGSGTASVNSATPPPSPLPP